jgi:hypothetical protein
VLNQTKGLTLLSRKFEWGGTLIKDSEFQNSEYEVQVGQKDSGSQNFSFLAFKGEAVFSFFPLINILPSYSMCQVGFGKIVPSSTRPTNFMFSLHFSYIIFVLHKRTAKKCCIWTTTILKVFKRNFFKFFKKSMMAAGMKTSVLAAYLDFL